MFPVHMKTKGSKPPGTVPHYVVAKNGIFLKKGNWWMEAVVPVKQIAVLEEQKAELDLKIQPISASVLMKTWKFFQAIFEKQCTESAVLLHYSKELGWEITVPTQSATFSHVDYEMKDRIPGYSFIGTMHSHSSMGAFHSGTDVGDEAQTDGIHITFGDLDEKVRFSLDPEVVINGTRFSLPMQYLQGVTQIKKTSGNASGSVFYTRTPRCTVECPELNDWKVPDEWIAKVQEKPFSYGLFKTQVVGQVFDWRQHINCLPLNCLPPVVIKNPTTGSNGDENTGVKRPPEDNGVII